MKNIWLKLKALKPKFQQLNAEEYKGITEKIDQSRKDLKDIQAQLTEQYTDALVDQEKICLQQLERWSLIEESILQQKSRVSWIKLGDSNSKYFSAVMKEKKQRKQILELNSLT